MTASKKWDRYFLNLCVTISEESPCLSRRVGVVIARDNIVISTGYNGPPRKIPHCGKERASKDNVLKRVFDTEVFKSTYDDLDVKITCPRKLLGYKSNEGLSLCPAQHAEMNAITNAARIGTSVEGATLYINSCIPCKNCLGAVINSGIEMIVVKELTFYDSLSEYIVDNSNLIIREFFKEEETKNA